MVATRPTWQHARAFKVHLCFRVRMHLMAVHPELPGCAFTEAANLGLLR